MFGDRLLPNQETCVTILQSKVTERAILQHVVSLFIPNVTEPLKLVL